MMIQQWWASIHDDLDLVMKKTWRRRWLEDKEDSKMKKTWRIEDEEDLKTKKTWRWQDDLVDAEKKTSAENYVERIPS